ncbi:MAG: hypothetical protein RIR79_202 [Pseudomonadota bacterium]|jgi:hypothetical protein
MNANKLFFSAVAISTSVLMGHTAFAVQGLDAHGQSKVSGAVAKKWSQSDSSKSGYQVQQGNTVTNIGSKKNGNCGVNVGTVQPGQKAPKEVVVTTKEVINVCK